MHSNCCNSAFFPKMEAELQQSSLPRRDPLQPSSTDPPHPTTAVGRVPRIHRRDLKTRQEFPVPEAGRKLRNTFPVRSGKKANQTHKTTQKKGWKEKAALPCPRQTGAASTRGPARLHPGLLLPQGSLRRSSSPLCSTHTPETEGRRAVPTQARRRSGGPRHDR